LSYYDLDDVALYIKGKHAANLERWRQVRRICFSFGLVMGSKLTDEKQLWEIEGDKKHLENAEEKIEMYKEALIKIGKWHKQEKN
jgi:hypothetical protein